MNKEDKDLLLRDLCARLPYDIKIDYEGRIHYLNEINPACKDIDYITVLIQDEDRKLCATHVKIDEIKPYLRPMSSMTEEEDKEWQLYKGRIAESCDELLEKRIAELHDWFCKNHLDYRGLIPKGLALEAPEGMYNEKKK